MQIKHVKNKDKETKNLVSSQQETTSNRTNLVSLDFSSETMEKKDVGYHFSNTEKKTVNTKF